MGRNLALAGIILIAIGVFCPLIYVPFSGSTNYVGNGTGDGALILILMMVASWMVWKRRMKLLIIPISMTAIIMITTLVRYSHMRRSLLQHVHDELGGTALAPLALTLVHQVSLQWGWLLLFAGLCCLTSSAWLQFHKNLNS